MSDARAALGESAEREAERHLIAQGCEILERRYRCRFGEVDLIVREGETLVFVEVKARSGSFAPAELSVDRRKQGRIVRAALFYLQAKRVEGAPLRFDVVALQGGELRHIRQAFSAEGYTR